VGHGNGGDERSTHTTPLFYGVRLVPAGVLVLAAAAIMGTPA